MPRSARVLLLVVAVALPAALARAADPGAPRLVLLVVVDQMRADYLDRFAPITRTGGLERLRRGGLSFRRAMHLHAVTSTGPGHATLSTGCHPRSHGIVSNVIPAGLGPDGRPTFKRVGTDASERNLCGEGPAASPRDLLRPTLADWIKRTDPRSKVVALSYKTRAAVLLGGRSPDACVWVDPPTGRFTTSSYYADEPPPFLVRANEDDPPDRWIGRVWRPELDERARRLVGCTGDAMPWEGTGDLRDLRAARFPHPIQRISDLPFTPFSDERVLRVALRALDALALGADESPDLLAVSFSSADYVGHAYGPDSWEIAEYYHWLDAALGTLVRACERAAGGRERLLVALTSDHGVGRIVELLLAEGQEAGRIRVHTIVETVDRALDDRFGPDDWVLRSLPDVYLDPTAPARHGATATDVRAEAARAARRIRGILDAWPRELLLAGDPAVPEEHRLSFHPERSGDVVIRFAPHYHIDYLDVAPYVKANHVSPYAYDRRVPVVLFGAGLPAGDNDDPFPTVDLAPTIASLIGVPIPPDVDGRPHRLSAAADG